MTTPRTNPVEILSFVAKAIKGELVLPFFQREFVWDNELKESLFESFLNAEYLNSIITATLKNDLLIPVRTLTSFFSSEERLEYKPGMEILIDGQQRISTLIEWLFSDVIGLMKNSNKKIIPIVYLKRNGDRIEIIKVEYINKNELISNVDLEEGMKKIASKYSERLSEENKELFSSYLGENIIERLKGNKSKKLKIYVLLSMALLEPFKYVKKIAENFVKYENETLKMPSFLIRYIPLFGERGNFSGTLMDFSFEKRKKLEDVIKRDEIVDFIRELESKLKDCKSKVTHVSFSGIDSVEALAEVFGKINTVQVKLGYFDIMESIIATIKGEPIDIREFLNDETSSYEYVSFLGKVEKFYDNFLSGFASWFELIKLTPSERKKVIRNSYPSINAEDFPYLLFRKYIEVGKRKISVGEYIKQLFESGVGCSKNNGKSASERLKECMREYIKTLDESLKKFDEITHLLTFYKALKGEGAKTLKLKGTILFFALPVFESITSDDQIRWKYFYEFSKFYLYSLFNSSNAFRHPEELIKSVESPKNSIVITPDGVYFPENYDIKEEMGYFLEDFIQIVGNENSKLDLEYLSPSDYFLMFYIQSLYSFKRNFVSEKEEVKKEYVKSGISNYAYSLDGEELKFSSSFRFDTHHIFPKKLKDGTVMNSRDHALNLVLLKRDKNQSISNNEPKEYWYDVIKVKNIKEVLEFNLIPVNKNVAPTETFIKSEKFKEALPDYSKKDSVGFLNDERLLWKDRFILLLEAIGHIFNFDDEELLEKAKEVLNSME